MAVRKSGWQVLPGSRLVRIDEKVRWRNRRTGKVYSDILLESIAEEERGKPGWVCKELLADYIAYAIAPLGKAYLLPVIQLQSAWRRCGTAWTAEYGTRRAASNGGRWHTVNVPVPVDVLFATIGGMLRAAFAPYEPDAGAELPLESQSLLP